MSKVEFFSFSNSPVDLRTEWNESIGKVISSGKFIGGSVVEDFEREWSDYLDASYAIGVGNGYDAIAIALKVAGVQPGDKVAVPSHTFVATWLAVGAVGGTPIGIDCNSSGLMDLDALESFEFEFKAVIPVHMHGQMVDMPRLTSWALKRNVLVIEDCAQAHGAMMNGKYAGTWGDFGAYSFYPTKNLGAIGDAGALVTNNPDLASEARSFANYGSIPGNKYKYQFLGINSRLDPIQASVLSINLKYLDEWNLQRRNVAARYLQKTSELGIKTLPLVAESVYHHFIVLSNNRDETRALLAKKGVATEIHYPECAAASYEKLSGESQADRYQNAFALSNKTLSLPMSPWITDDEVEYVLDVLENKEVMSSFH